MKQIKLIREIDNAAGTDKISEVNLKEEAEMNAADFYDITMSADGKMELGNFAAAIANLTGLTSSQVASMHPKDFMMLCGEVGKYIQ